MKTEKRKEMKKRVKEAVIKSERKRKRKKQNGKIKKNFSLNTLTSGVLIDQEIADNYILRKG